MATSVEDNGGPWPKQLILWSKGVRPAASPGKNNLCSCKKDACGPWRRAFTCDSVPHYRADRPAGKELLANFRELKKALGSVFGYGADMMLKRLSEEREVAMRSCDKGFNEMVDGLRREGPLASIRSVDYDEHVLLLYQTTAFRDRMVAGFFDSPAEESKAAVIAGAVPASVAATTYEKLAGRYGENSW